VLIYIFPSEKTSTNVPVLSYFDSIYKSSLKSFQWNWTLLWSFLLGRPHWRWSKNPWRYRTNQPTEMLWKNIYDMARTEM